MPSRAKATVGEATVARSLSEMALRNEELLEERVNRTDIAVEEAPVVEAVRRERAVEDDFTLRGWMRGLDLHDWQTERHSRRVAILTVRLAKTLGVNRSDLDEIQRGALLHDIGKIRIPREISRKPGPLTDEEWTLMQQHPVFALELLAPVPSLGPSLNIPYCHHERWDGTGYPRGLCGTQIPFPARLFSIIDVSDALRSERPYGWRWSDAAIREYIARQAGTQFDPEIAVALLRMDSKEVFVTSTTNVD